MKISPDSDNHSSSLFATEFSALCKFEKNEKNDSFPLQKLTFIFPENPKKVQPVVKGFLLSLAPALDQFLCNSSCDKETEVIPNIKKEKKSK